MISFASAPARARFTSSVLPLGLLLGLFGGFGCGGGAAEAPGAQTGAARSAESLEAACGDYARSLCEELGSSSEACRAALSVLVLMPAKACAAGLDEFAVTRERIAELRNDCQEVATRVCRDLGDDSEACVALKQDLPNIPPGHCGALKRDADRLVAALREREAALQPLSDALWSELLAGDPPGFGAADAAVVLVEFSDFQCPYCAEAARTVHAIKERYGSRVRFVFRNFPLPSHPDALGAAQAAAAAHEQGKFWNLHDQMFANQQSLGSEALAGHAKSAGLDVAAFQKASKGDAARTRVQHDVELGERVQVRGTPTLLLNNTRLENALDVDAVAEAIDAELASQSESAPAEAQPAPVPAPPAPKAKAKLKVEPKAEPKAEPKP